MEEFWELPEEIQSYIEENNLPLKMYSHPVGEEAFSGLKPKSGLVTAILSNEKGEILFIKHSEKNRVWELPSGHIEPNERPDDAIEREINEETGFKVESIKPILAIIWPFKDTVRVQIVFEGSVSEQLYDRDNEAVKLKWMESIPEDVTLGEFGQEIYEYYIENTSIKIDGTDKYKDYLKHSMTVLGAIISLAALKGFKSYRESDENEEKEKLD